MIVPLIQEQTAASNYYCYYIITFYFCYNAMSQKPGFNLYQSRLRTYITYSVKTWFLKILSVLHYHILN